METLKSMVDETLLRLGDADETIWSESEIRDYLMEGYRDLAVKTKFLRDFTVCPDFTAVFTHTSAFEKDFILQESGWLLGNEAQYTGPGERYYVDNGKGPYFHTGYWETNDGHLDDDGTVPDRVHPLCELPEDLVEINRVTWDTKRIFPLTLRELDSDSQYEFETGDVDGYSRKKDGLDQLRKYRIPDAHYVPHEMTGDGWGILRQYDDISEEDDNGTWGIVRQFAGEEVVNETGIWGMVRTIWKETGALRIEYTVRPKEISQDTDTFDLPDYMLKYVRFFALSRALHREGDGQQKKMSEHFAARYKRGVDRLSLAWTERQRQRKIVVGGKANKRRRRPPKPRLPYPYPSTPRY